jgi:hypothetical protein
MTEQTYPKQPPLTIAETAAKLREKPHTLICNENDILPLMKALDPYDFYFSRVGDGEWDIFDKLDDFLKGKLLSSKFQAVGQTYIVDKALLDWSKPNLIFNPRPQPESVVWSRLMHYGKGY